MVKAAKSQGLGEELASLDLGDARIERRARTMLTDLARSPDRSFPQTWSNDSELEAGYRFFSNDNAKPRAIVDAHASKTVQRAAAQQSPVLVAHDTTELCIPLYFSDKLRKGLGTKSSRQQGFDAHVSFAVGLDERATPLGTLALQAFIGKDEATDARSKEFWEATGGLYDNEMQRWRDGILRAGELLAHLEQQVIHTGDRELGRYNMLAWMSYCGLDFVVRAALDQLAAGRKPRLSLTDALAATPWTGSVTAMIARRAENRSKKAQKTHPSRQARKVCLSFRAKTLELVRADHKDAGAAYNPLGPVLPERLSMNIVEILELDPPVGEAPIHWVLVTSLPIETLAQQLFVVTCSRRRWIIEELFRALKQGCKYERRQLESAKALLVALALFLPVAWYLLRIQTTVAEAPNLQWRRLFSPAVVTAVRRLAPQLALRATATVEQVYLGIASIGGHLKRNGAPGWQTFIRGFADVVAALKGMGVTTVFQVAINP